MPTSDDHLTLAIQLAWENVRTRKGRPFGAVLVKDGRIVATGVNSVVSSHDPTAHAELEAIRAAAQTQQNPRLDGHVMYASGHPCPMCLAAMYLAGIRKVFYAYSNEEVEPFGLSTKRTSTPSWRSPFQNKPCSLSIGRFASPSRISTRLGHR